MKSLKSTSHLIKMGLPLNPVPSKPSLKLVFIPIFVIVLWAIFSKPLTDSEDALVVYCSHDSIFSDAILQKFTAKTGIKVTPRYDTEASKSLGLTEKLLREGTQSDCDVFWSNEMFSMQALQNAGLLESYKGSGWERMPSIFKDEKGYWCGFAARMRVVIYNTERVNDPSSINTALFPDSDLSKRVIALPLFGTTLTHFAALDQNLGENELKAIYKQWRQQGLQIVAGNGPARNMVANGNCDYGWTDTDDYFGAIDRQAPVAMLPVKLPNNETIVIPNTVGIMNFSSKIEQAKALADFLLSEQVEIDLAQSSSRQIPLGPTSAVLPAEVESLIPYVKHATNLKPLIHRRTPLISWLKEEHDLK
jgi:iron(III) transport system substrate-binding protein